MTRFNDAMREVLTRPRYNRLTGRTPDLSAAVEDALTRFIKFLIERFDLRLSDTAGINTQLFSWFFMLLGAALAATAVFFIARHVLRLRRAGRTPRGEADVMEEIARRDLSAAEWLRLSRRHYEEGAFREAVRYRYMGVLAALHEKRVIRLEASKTNAQIEKELAASAPALLPFFKVTADCFHRVWFGCKPLKEDEYRRFAAATGELAS